MEPEVWHGVGVGFLGHAMRGCCVRALGRLDHRRGRGSCPVSSLYRNSRRASCVGVFMDEGARRMRLGQAPMMGISGEAPTPGSFTRMKSVLKEERKQARYSNSNLLRNFP